MLLHAILLLLGSLAVSGDRGDPCDTSLVHGVTLQEVSFSMDGGNMYVKCADRQFFVKIKDSDTLYYDLKCNRDNGWTGSYSMFYSADPRKIADAKSNMTISCVSLRHCEDKPFAEDYSHNFKSVPDYLGHTIKVNCTHGSSDKLTGIVVKNADRVKDGDLEERYESLHCDKDGWTARRLDGDADKDRAFDKSLGRFNPFDHDTPRTTFYCFEYCTVMWKTGLNHTINEATNEKVYTCADSSHKLFLNGVPVRKPEIACSMWKGWGSHETRDANPDHSPWTTQHVECKSGGKRSVRSMRIAEGNEEE